MLTCDDGQWPVQRSPRCVLLQLVELQRALGRLICRQRGARRACCCSAALSCLLRRRAQVQQHRLLLLLLLLVVLSSRAQRRLRLLLLLLVLGSGARRRLPLRLMLLRGWLSAWALQVLPGPRACWLVTGLLLLLLPPLPGPSLCAWTLQMLLSA